MGFPFSYTGKIILNSGSISYVDVENIKKQLQPADAEATAFFFQKGFLGLPVRFSIKSLMPKESNGIEYCMFLFETNTISLLGLVFTTFFFGYHQLYSAWFAATITLLFYSFSLAVNGHRLHKFLMQLIDANEESLLDEQWENQQQWLKDIAVCPACGEPANPYSDKCINCGLYLGKAPKSMGDQNSNSTESINYTYISDPDNSEKD